MIPFRRDALSCRHANRGPAKQTTSSASLPPLDGKPMTKELMDREFVLVLVGAEKSIRAPALLSCAVSHVSPPFLFGYPCLAVNSYVTTSCNVVDDSMKMMVLSFWWRNALTNDYCNLMNSWTMGENDGQGMNMVDGSYSLNWRQCKTLIFVPTIQSNRGWTYQEGNGLALLSCIGLALIVYNSPRYSFTFSWNWLSRLCQAFTQSFGLIVFSMNSSFTESNTSIFFDREIHTYASTGRNSQPINPLISS